MSNFKMEKTRETGYKRNKHRPANQLYFPEKYWNK